MSSKVHKIFALYFFNQSQTHKSYPLVEIETGNKGWAYRYRRSTAGGLSPLRRKMSSRIGNYSEPAPSLAKRDFASLNLLIYHNPPAADL